MTWALSAVVLHSILLSFLIEATSHVSVCLISFSACSIKDNWRQRAKVKLKRLDIKETRLSVLAKLPTKLPINRKVLFYYSLTIFMVILYLSCLESLGYSWKGAKRSLKTWQSGNNSIHHHHHTGHANQASIWVYIYKAMQLAISLTHFLLPIFSSLYFLLLLWLLLLSLDLQPFDWAKNGTEYLLKTSSL